MKELVKKINEYEGGFVYTLRDEKGMAGYITATKCLSDNIGALKIDKFIVRPELRGQKIASELHTKLVNWAKVVGYKEIVIELAPKKEEDLVKMSLIMEHFGYKCVNPEMKGKRIPLGYHLSLI